MENLIIILSVVIGLLIIVLIVTALSIEELNKKILISLIYAGCFSNLGYNMKTLINNLDNIINYAELSQDVGMLELVKPELQIYNEYPNELLISNQLSTFGFYLSNHPVTKYRTTKDIITTKIKEYYDKNITMTLLITKIKEITTKNNDIMAFVTGTDEYGQVSLTLFPKQYKEYKKIKEYDIINIRGKVEKRYDTYQIIVNNLNIFTNYKNSKWGVKVGEACTNPDILRIIAFIFEILKIVYILIPIALIVMISLDFAKNVMSSKTDDMDKNLKKAIKRILYCICIYWLPTIAYFAINTLGNLGVPYTTCITNANEEKIDELTIDKAKELLSSAKEKITNLTKDDDTSKIAAILDKASTEISYIKP